MKTFAYTTFFLCLIFSSLEGADYTPPQANPTEVRIIAVIPTPEPDNVQTTITFPDEDELVPSSPVKMQIRLLGFPTGVPSDFERKNEIYNDPRGQSMLIFIDNQHPVEIYKSFIYSLDENNLYNSLILTTELPFDLKEGMHLIRCFPARSFGEGLKGPGCFKAQVFYFRKKDNPLKINLNAPYLTYNEPLETLKYQEDLPILLDFYVSNTRLSRDGYKVKVTIDHAIERILTLWVPYYIYGLKKGKHSIRLELLNEKNEVAPGPLNQVERSITIH